MMNSVMHISSQTGEKVIDPVNLEVSFGKIRNLATQFIEVRVLSPVRDPDIKLNEMMDPLRVRKQTLKVDIIEMMGNTTIKSYMKDVSWGWPL